MKNNISVDEALVKGRRMVTLNKLLRVYRARSENKSNGHTFSK